MRPLTLAFVILGCVAAATAGLTSCADGNCAAIPVERQLVAVEPVNTAVSEHHRTKRAPILGKIALLGAGALGIGALGAGALGIGALGAGALGAGAIGAGVLGAGVIGGGGYARSYGGYGGYGGYGYGGPHYHYHSSPVVYGGGYGGGLGGYGGGYSSGYSSWGSYGGGYGGWY